MLMGFFGRAADGDEGDAEQYRRAALNTIGPVWDGNEVWIITAGAAMFAAFPGMYATVFSGLYLPLLAILVGMIVRVCAIEWRGKIDDPQWRRWADIGIAMGSWLPAVLWGVAFASILRGLPVDARHQIQLSFGDVLNPYSSSAVSPRPVSSRSTVRCSSPSKPKGPCTTPRAASPPA